MGKKFTKKIITENGREFLGFSFGADTDAVCELVFNTSVVGYQELITDPACANQAVVMTYPLIGNYGITDEDNESRTPVISGLVAREYNDLPSNFRYTRTLSETLEENGIVGISGVDTREITRMLRDEGNMRCLITSPDVKLEDGLKKISETPIPKNLIAKVSCKKRWYSRTADFKYNVVVIDCGVKHNIIRTLNKCACNVTIVPYNTTAEEITALCPDGLVVSGGPGNPADAKEVIETVKALKGKLPIFGICTGHLIMCLAAGAEIVKMKSGHHGGNHPVKRLSDGKLETTSQGHSYVAVEESLKKVNLKVTHLNVLDGTVEGIESEENKFFSVQYRPEGAPGPADSGYLFDKFIKMMQ